MRLLHAAVLATRRVPVVGAAWRMAYAGASAACARGLASLPGVSAVVLHRGAARRPEPGVSDLDFILVREPLPAAAESAWLGGLGAARRRLRRAFPMLGDVWVAEPAELGRYLRVGGLRAWEDRPGWRTLAGELPAPPLYEGSALKRRLDAWVWAFVSHMELTRRLLRPGRDLTEKRDADARKMHADALRLSAFAGSRGDGSPAPRPAPDPRPLRALWLEAAGALNAASETLVAEAADGASSAPPWAPPRGGALAAAERGLRSLGARALVVDAPYHTWAVFDDGAAPERLFAAARALAAEPLLPGVPLALTASSWSLLLQSSYLGAPLGGLDGPAVPSGDGLFGGWGPTSLGDPRGALARLPAELRRAAADEAAAWMAVWWRGLWTEESFPNRFVLYHLHVRAAQLAHARAGRPVPSAWDALLSGPALRFAREEPAACVDGVPRAALAPEHAAAVAAALARLGDPA